MGFEYELLERMAEDMGLQLEIKVVRDLDKAFDQLNSGEADLLAHGMTITKDRQEEVSFTNYLYLVKQVLVQRKPDNWRRMSWSRLQKATIQDPIELIGDTVAVRANSSYFGRLANLSEEIGGVIHIDTMPGEISTDEIIQKVVDGDIKYTISDDNIAKINASYHPILDIDVAISFSQRVGWALRKNSPELLSAINEWIEKERSATDYYVIYNKYFKNKRRFRKRSESTYYSLNSNEISEYDGMIKTYADTVGWDWRLLASQIYQESHFEPGARSWAGASGLMQIMPATARSLGVSDPSDPHQSLKGGTLYLKKLHTRFDDIPDSVQRIKFTLAAYNCGYMHVRDAQKLAEAEDRDPTHWDDHVEEMVLALSHPQHYNKPFIKYGYVRGREPVNYVDEIFKRYEHFLNFIEE